MRDVVRLALQKDPEKRPACEGLLALPAVRSAAGARFSPEAGNSAGKSLPSACAEDAVQPRPPTSESCRSRWSSLPDLGRRFSSKGGRARSHLPADAADVVEELLDLLALRDSSSRASTPLISQAMPPKPSATTKGMLGAVADADADEGRTCFFEPVGALGLEMEQLTASGNTGTCDQKLQEQPAHRLYLQLQLLSGRGRAGVGVCGSGTAFRSRDGSRSGSGKQLPKLRTGGGGGSCSLSSHCDPAISGHGAVGDEFWMPCAGSASRMLRRRKQCSSHGSLEFGATVSILAGVLVGEERSDAVPEGLQCATECAGLQSFAAERMCRISPQRRLGRKRLLRRGKVPESRAD